MAAPLVMQDEVAGILLVGARWGRTTISASGAGISWPGSARQVGLV
ncbi:MAG: hypothetical protein M9927_20800 [Anaerolineae bacterium]|nr:hypothetical protein [Anaerolineae bacterium]